MSRPRPTPWSPLFAAGHTAGEAARIAGRSRTSAYIWARSEGVQWPRPKPNAGPVLSKRAQAARELPSNGTTWREQWDAGASLNQASAAMGKSRGVGKRWAACHGLNWAGRPDNPDLPPAGSRSKPKPAPAPKAARTMTESEARAAIRAMSPEEQYALLMAASARDTAAAMRRRTA